MKAKYITFEPIYGGWIVKSKNGAGIGVIEFYAPWRKNVFCPYESTVYDTVCLKDIAAFLEENPKERIP